MTAVTSILHRLSGLILFLSVPVLIYALQQSLLSEAGFNSVVALLSLLTIKVIFLIVTWAILHHLLAGIRFLILDFDIGISKPIARMSAWIVTFTALGLFLLIAWKVLL